MSVPQENRCPLKTCSCCRLALPHDQFGKDVSTSDGLTFSCKTCRKNSRTKYRARHGDKARSASANWEALNKPRRNAWRRHHRLLLKIEVMSHYSGGIPACKCCGDAVLDFLTVDHEHNDGAQHRRDNHLIGGYPTYAFLKRNSYPQGFRVLCRNCNSSIGLYGYCPHQIQRGTG